MGAIKTIDPAVAPSPRGAYQQHAADRRIGLWRRKVEIQLRAES